MGQSISRETCVELSHLPADQWQSLADEDITVIRTNGEHQAGWRFPRLRHYGPCNASGYSWVAAHVGSTAPDAQERKLRFHMTRDSTPRDPNQHVCGWRKERTFWPTRLDGDEEAKKVWWDALDVMVNSLRIRDSIPAEELAVLDAAQDKLDAEHQDAERAERIAADRAEDERYAMEKEAAATNQKWREALVESMTVPNDDDNAQYKTFTDHIMDLQKINVWHADRVRRLFDCGFPKSKVAEVCQIADNDAREKRLDGEEALRYLEPLVKHEFY